MKKVIIAVLNQKGGVGKSMIAYHLAAALGDAGLQTALLDYDPQGTAYQMFMDRTGPVSFQVIKQVEAEHGHISAASPQLDPDLPGAVIIDTPPSYPPNIREALALAHLAILPMQPTPADLQATLQLAEMIRRAQAQRQGAPAALYVFNRVKRANIAELIQQEAAAAGIKPCALIPDSVIFQEAGLAGLPVQAINPKHRAADELLKLSREVIRWIKRN